jgi:acetoacetate decarboxylase
MVAFPESTHITYPPAPWQLQGYALIAYHLIDLVRSRSFLPSGLEPVSVFPGKTLGGVYIARYTAGSILEYNELIVFPGLVRYENRVAPWVSHIYVDNLQSMAGGREIWGLPKELAEFTWTEDNVSVRQGDRVLANLRYKPSFLPLETWWKPSLGGEVFGGLNGELLAFKGEFKSRFQWQNGRLTVPIDSPFSALELEQPLVTVAMRELQADISAPAVVGTIEPRVKAV